MVVIAIATATATAAATATGTYVLKEDIHLATPPAHPSEPPVTNPNPLSTAPHPVVAGTKLSLVQIKPRTSAAAQAAESLPLPTNLYRHPTVSASSRDTATHDGPESHFSADTTDGNSSLGSKSGGGPGADPAYPHHVPEKFGNGNASLAPAASGKNHHQRKRPKTNIAKSNSSFVSRIVTHESLTRRLAERSPEDLMAFANVNRAFCWLDLDSPIKVCRCRCRCRGGGGGGGAVLTQNCSKNRCPKPSLPRRTQSATTSTC